MWYKTNWEYRFQIESERWISKYPGYMVITTSSDRNKNYTPQEIEQLIFLKKCCIPNHKIAEIMGRSYWSIVYKLSELRRLNLLS